MPRDGVEPSHLAAADFEAATQYGSNVALVRIGSLRVDNLRSQVITLSRQACEERGFADTSAPFNPTHPEGRHKARVFLSALGLTAADSEWLASALLQNLGAAEAVKIESTPWGELFRADLGIWRGTRCAKVRTGWLCQGKTARLTTCFIFGECDETA